MGVGDFGRRHHLSLCGLRPGVGNVVADRSDEQNRFLRNEADLAPERSQLQISHVSPIDLNDSICRIVESGDQVDQGRLPCSAGADDCHPLTCFHTERDAPQHRCLAVIAK